MSNTNQVQSTHFTIPNSESRTPRRPTAGVGARTHGSWILTSRSEIPADNQPSRTTEQSPHSNELNMPQRSAEDSDYDADVEVVQPYAIEEPDDGEPPSKPRKYMSSLPDHFERWHVDLIGSMEDLSCEAETDSSSRFKHRRGQKRKPAATGAHPHTSSHAGSKHGDMQDEEPGLTRKRPRRRTRRVKEGIIFDHGSSSNVSHSPESYRSSSSAAPRSTDGSGTETGVLNTTPDSEKMDID